MNEQQRQIKLLQMQQASDKRNIAGLRQYARRLEDELGRETELPPDEPRPEPWVNELRATADKGLDRIHGLLKFIIPDVILDRKSTVTPRVTEVCVRSDASGGWCSFEATDDGMIAMVGGSEENDERITGRYDPDVIATEDYLASVVEMCLGLNCEPHR